MKTEKYRICRAVAIACAMGWTAVAAEQPPPNVVLIMADDLGPEMLGCYGAEDVKTPNIDRLARADTFFETCWAVPVCGPSRALLMTGRYGYRTGEWNMGDRPGGPGWAQPHLNFCRDQPTFGKMLKKAWYATALAGKWQLVSPPRINIRAAGFDEYSIWSIPYHYGFGSREIRNEQGDLAPCGSRYWYPAIEQNGKPLLTSATDYGPDINCDFLIGFMHRNRQMPFLLYFPLCLPHEPIGSTPDWKGPISDSKETIKCNTEYIDVLVGRLVAAVAAEGLTERTVFIFCGDNGTETNGKNTPTDQACRVPMIFKGPGIKAQGRVDALTDFTDIMPTLAALAGTSLPAGFEFDGHDLGPVLRGESAGEREWIFSYMGPFRMVRTRNWILEAESEDHPGVLYHSAAPALYEDKTNDPEAGPVRRRLQEILADKPVPVVPAAERRDFIDYLFDYHHGDNMAAIPESSRNCLQTIRNGLSDRAGKPD